MATTLPWKIYDPQGNLVARTKCLVVAAKLVEHYGYGTRVLSRTNRVVWVEGGYVTQRNAWPRTLWCGNHVGLVAFVQARMAA